jgi:hypothetical protein
MLAMRSLVVSAAVATVLSAAAARADIVTWADWTADNGTAVLGNIGGIGVRYTGERNPAAQLNNTGTYFWSPSGSFLNATVSNVPVTSDVVRLTGGANIRSTVEFDQPVTNPVFLILSLGQGGLPTSYEFDAPFTILSQGGGFFGGGSLEQAGTTLIGREGHGAIQFLGTFTSIGWDVPTAEFWHGFTVGVIPAPGATAFCVLGSAVALRQRRR